MADATPRTTPTGGLRERKKQRTRDALIRVALHMRAYRMIESTPALIAAHLRRSTELEEETAQFIARRAGLDVDADPRPRVLVAAFSGAMRVAGRVWGTGDDCSVAGMRE